jgi:hypothetical protein
LITTLIEADEMHPAALVTVKLYVPATRLLTVVFTPVPAIAPGLIVQLPAGNPFSITLPVVVEQVGCVMRPTDGAEGVVFGAAIPEPGELVHPEIVCVTVYVPAVLTVIDEVVAEVLHNNDPV